MGNDSNERRSKRGGTSGSNNVAAKRRFGDNSRIADPPRLEEVNAIGKLLDAIIGQGDALMFARTSDGGAVVLVLMRDRDREKVYATSQPELQDAIDWLRDEYLEVPMG